MQDNKGGGLSWSQPGENQNAVQPKQTQAAWNKMPSQVSKGSALAANAHGSVVQASDRSGLVLSFVAGLVVGVLLMWVWSMVSLGGKGATSTETGANASANGASQVLTAGTFTLSSVQTAGFSVGVSAVAVSAPTWIVVYESRNGSIGNALGAALFTPESTGGSVNLLRGTVSGQMYFVGQRRDNGDHVFSLESDIPALDQNGKPALVQFTTP